MRVLLFAILGFFLGAVAGGALGVGAGALWVWMFNTSGFEGYSAMLVFFTFMPIGAILGATGGAVGLALLAGRGRGSRPPGDPQ
jgi:hypothetical protein